MQSQTQDNKRIAKNTAFLYIRMLFIMAVTLFTSRVVLDKLGVDDFGIYGAVGGVVGMLGFLNGTLSIGTSRFLTFELGTNNIDRLKATFNTAFYTHLALALIVALCLETGGLWFLYHKLLIPEERLFAAECVLHFSVIATIVSVTQVPYTSTIIAHEDMKIYAYLGIFEALAKLGIVYLLSISNWDRLIYYAVLVAIVQIIVALCYRFYSIRKYSETRLELHFDKSIFKEMLGFSGWNLIANISEMLGHQGITVLINMFFMPAVVAAQSIAAQMVAALNQFVNNFRTAINPQIIKLYASGEYEESKNLTLNSSIYVFDLLLLLGLPCIVVMEPLLNLWLVEVPDYAVVFAQYSVTRIILGNWGNALYIPMVASGKLKENSIASIFVTMLGFVVLYFLLRAGLSVMFVQYIGVLQTCLYSFVVKPWILCKKIDYRASDIFHCFARALKIAILPVTISILISLRLDVNNLLNMFIAVALICLSVVISAYFFLDKTTKVKLHHFVLSKMRFSNK